MIDKTISIEFIVSTLLAISFFAVTLYTLLIYVRRKSDADALGSYNFKENIAEIEYMRRNLEEQLYKVSKKLEENEKRWIDINHLLITTQNKSEENKNNNSNNRQVLSSPFLENLGLKDKDDFKIIERQVFLLTPFNEEYSNDFHTVRKVCESLKLKCIRGDEEYVPNDVFTFILKQIVNSRLVVANITGRNPNVMYELGVAHSLGKPTIIISKNFTDIPFDLNNKRIIIFGDENDLYIKLKSSITDMLLNKDL